MLTAEGLRCRLPYSRVPLQARQCGFARPSTNDDWVVVLSVPIDGHFALARLLELSVVHATVRTR